MPRRPISDPLLLLYNTLSKGSKSKEGQEKLSPRTLIKLPAAHITTHLNDRFLLASE